MKRITILLLLTLPLPVAADWDAAMTELRAEPRIKDLQYEADHSVLRIGVLNDGSNRDGYAQYVCATLHAHAAGGSVLIKIIDIGRLVSEKEWVTLGEHYCR